MILRKHVVIEYQESGDTFLDLHMIIILRELGSCPIALSMKYLRWFKIFIFSLLMVPAILRILASLQGLYTCQAVESAVQAYYFAFIFVQVFLVVSLSASIATVLEQLKHGAESVPALLVQGLHKASNYFLSYLIIHTAGSITGTLLLPSQLFNLLLSPLFDVSARRKWSRREDMYLQRWGTFVPVYTNLACIGKAPRTP